METQILYSASVNGFYDRAIHDVVPNDAIAISRDDHIALIEGQSTGKLIVPDASGRPKLVDPPEPTKAELTEIARGKRSQAYKLEADPIFFKSQRGEATQEEWLAKIEEIKARYPDPV